MFLISRTRSFITLSDVNDIRTFFSTIVFSVLVLSILLLIELKFLYVNSRRRKLGILRIFGTRNIKINVLYLPHFFQGMECIDTVGLVGLAGDVLNFKNEISEVLFLVPITFKMDSII